MAVTVNRSGVLIFLLVSMICMMAAEPIQTSKLSNNNDIDDNRPHGNELQPRKHKYHHLLLLGGLKGWIALILIKAKIILVSVAVAAVIFALKFADIFKRPVPYSSPYSIAYEPAYDFGPPIHHSAHDKYGNDLSSSNSYAKRVFETTKPSKYSNYSGGKRKATRR